MAGESILIVDDDERNRRLLRDILSLHGYRVRDVDSGEACLAEVAREVPAAILMDIQMPGIGGLGAARELAAHPRREEIRLVALTASSNFLTPAMQHDHSALRRVGFDALHPKPIDLERLIADLEAMFG